MRSLVLYQLWFFALGENITCSDITIDNNATCPDIIEAVQYSKVISGVDSTIWFIDEIDNIECENCEIKRVLTPFFRVSSILYPIWP